MEVRPPTAPPLVLDSLDQPEAVALFERLLNQAFPVPEGASYFDDFPVWKHAPDPSCRLGVRAGEALASCAAARIATLRVGAEGQVVPIALIGAVASDPAWRGKGLASRCVQVAVDWAMAHGAEAALLWSSELEMYERLGFRLAGSQHLLSIGDLPQPLMSSDQNPVPRTGWVPGLFRRLQARKEGLLLGPADRTWIQDHRNVEWLWRGSPELPEAFVAIGKGIDLSGIIHEWGGDPDAVRSLLLHLKRSRPDLRVLGSPEGLARIGFVPSGSPEALCLAQPLRPEADSWIQEGRFWLWGLDGA